HSQHQFNNSSFEQSADLEKTFITVVFEPNPQELEISPICYTPLIRAKPS
ncbi:19977_t:CDS:2, partial [Racocetra persica]